MPAMATRPRPAPSNGIGRRLAERILDLAEQVRRLHPPGHRDPERFWLAKSELAAQLAALAHDAEIRLEHTWP